MRKVSFNWMVSYILLGSLMAVLLLRAFWGADLTDESFYFALAKRFAQGDQLLVDEWFPTQLIGVLLLPLYKIYIALNGTQEGIILCARMLYVLFSGVVAMYMLRVLQKNDETSGYSFFVSAMFLIYVRASIGTFSYYSLGLQTFLIAILLCWDKDASSKKRYKWICAGISFSISVICMPYMVFVFGVLVWKFLISFKESKIRKIGPWFFGGIVCSLLIFLCLLGEQIISGIGNLPEILMDPQHQGSMLENVVGVMRYLIFTYLRYTWPLYFITLSVGCVIFGRKISNDRWIGFYKRVILVEFILQSVYSRTYFEGGIVFAVLLLAIQIQLVNYQMRMHDYERYFLLPGLGFGFVWIIGSNVGMRVFNMGFLLADVWALKVIWEDGRYFAGKWRRSVVIFILFGVLLMNRFFDVYRDNPIWDMDARIEVGSMKGIFTSSERKYEYEILVENLAEYTSNEDRIAVPGLNPWIYLEAPAKCGSYSVWNVNFGDARNWIYYEKYPKNFPNVIFLLSPSWGKYEGWKFGSHGTNEIGSGIEQADGILREFLEKYNYQKLECESGTLYRLE